MKYQFYWMFILSYFIHGCYSQTIKVVEFQKLQEVVLSSVTEQDKTPLFPQLIQEKGKTYLVIFNDTKRAIYYYDWKAKKLEDSTLISINKGNQIWAITYASFDSIFIVFNAAQNLNYNHDSTVININRKGLLTNVYHVANFPIFSNKNHTDSLSYISMKYKHLLYNNNNLFIQFEPFKFVPGDTGFSKIYYPVGGHIDLSTQENKTHLIKIPNKVGEYYAKRGRVPTVAITQKGNPVYGFYHTSNLLEYDLQTDKIIVHKAASIFGDRVKPLPLEVVISSKIPQDDYTQISFEQLYYHPYLKLYYRIIRLPLPENATPDAKRNPNYSILFLDLNFNLLGEGIIPKDVIPINFVTEKGICFWNKQGTKETSNQILFSEYGINFRDKPLDYLLSQIKPIETNSKNEFGLNNLISDNYKHPIGKHCVMFVPIVGSCKSCANEALTFFKSSSTKYNIYLLLSTDTKTEYDAIIKTYELIGDNIWNDEKGLYKKYLPPPVTSGTIVLFDGDKLIREITLIPENMRVIDSKVLELWTKEKSP